MESQVPNAATMQMPTIEQPVPAVTRERGLRRSPGKVLGIAAFTALVAVGAVKVGSSEGGAVAPAAAAETPSETAHNLFNIDTVNVDCIEIADDAGTAETVEINIDGHTETRVFPEIGALKPVGQDGQNTRLWTDSMRNPLTSIPTAEAATNELFASFCEDPLEAVTFAHMLNNLAPAGQRVGDMEDEGLAWLQEYDIPEDQIAAKAASMVNLNNSMTDQEAADGNQRHQNLAEREIMVLQRLQNAGIIDVQTILNYHVNEAGVLSDGMPAVGLNPAQMMANMLAFRWVNKPGDCIAVLGFNTGDQRPELAACAPPETTTTTQPGETTTTGPHGSTTTTRPHGSTTTTIPRSSTTTTTAVGPKNCAQDPHQAGCVDTGTTRTTVETPTPGPSTPTTTPTTRPPETIPPSTIPGTSTTEAPPTTQPARP